MRTFAFTLALLALSFAPLRAATLPVVVVGDDFVLQGITSSSLFGGSFSVTNGQLTCSGTFNPYDRAPTITMQTQCSDGRTGNVVSSRDPSYQAGSGSVTFSDGSHAIFYFGANATLYASQALARLRTQAMNAAPAAPLVEAPTYGLPRGSSHAVRMVKTGGIYAVPVVVNGAIRLNFLVDSGSADVSIPSDVVSTLIRSGTIQKDDVLGSETHVLADGRKLKSVSFRIRSLRVGDVTIENVKGSMAPPKGALLLGQTFLERFSSWSVDNGSHTLNLQ
jgi:predicted aspartyl protease